MKSSTAGHRNGIQWTLTQQLDDLDYADDIALLSHSGAQMQNKTSVLEERDMEDDSQNGKKVTICQSLFASNPEDTLDRQDHKRGALGVDRSNTDGQASEEEKMDVGRPNAEKTFKQHCEASPALESTGKTKEGTPQEYLEEEYGKRDEGPREELEGAATAGRKEASVAAVCRWPMLQPGARGLTN
ncbi:hypothetical protein AWC38_SpisGene2549 [Stylophora pistillata]|uniref:Reverse transcriptase domain-containing protein n=1 Tax=Stylophora pistillata TaxID=50429 RepID=A0A2B4SU35_STYPI|nr:hypothetical protein AWC38_SpisGene2549 [Stylophora pistillata]